MKGETLILHKAGAGKMAQTPYSILKGSGPGVLAITTGGNCSNFSLRYGMQSVRRAHKDQ